ncbi:hypothetical protein [Kitasatospora sp. LaBMicrA B282]|uniref:hypothetical protein n=1 Tax=Kitasatospora sp. LaBMicrA B282 TaxID=3420949 RepID=UPI003D0AF772
MTTTVRPTAALPLLAANPGLAARFSRTLEFEDHSVDALVNLVERAAAGDGYRLAEGTRAALARQLGALPAGPAHGSGRAARTVFEEMVDRQASRLAALGELGAADLALLVPEDCPEIDTGDQCQR